MAIGIVDLPIKDVDVPQFLYVLPEAIPIKPKDIVLVSARYSQKISPENGLDLWLVVCKCV